MEAYVYIWFRPDWTPFYVGIGKTPSRWKPTRAKAKDRNPLCMKVLKKHGAANVRVQRFIGLTWEEACAKERALIAHFGRISDGGLLANFTDGGEGVLRPREEVTAARRAKAKQVDNPLYGRHAVLNTDPEIKKLRIEGIRAAQEKRKAKMADPEARAARIAKLKATLAAKPKAPKKEKPRKRTKEELAAFRRAMMHARNADPELQANRIAALKAASDKISAGVLSSAGKRATTMQTPEVQAKLRRPKTAEHNAKVAAAKREWWAARKA